MPEPSIHQKSWSKELEAPIVRDWVSKEPYAFDEKSKKKTFSIDTPPPYINAPVHIGQATTYAMMDMFARYKRMQGFEVLFPLGLDGNGLPIETAAEKKFNIRLKDVGREKFLEYCRTLIQESGLATSETFQRMGVSFNSWKKGSGVGSVYETHAPEYRTLTQSTFIDLYNKKLIYEDERISNYCPGCGTTIADSEIGYKDQPSQFHDIVFKVKETGENIVIGTTRPELVPSCGMVIFHPTDERYANLNGKTAITPLFNREVPIKAHTLAEKEKGTGLVMMCSAGDYSDIRFFREMKLKPIISIALDGTLNENAGFLKGLRVKEARKTYVEQLKEKGLHRGQRDVLHRTPICERSGDAIEFIELKEYYLKQLQALPKLKAISKKMNFFAPESRQILSDWMESVSTDWPISRRRYFATEIPLWNCKQCANAVLAKKGTYVQPWRESPPVKKCPKCGSTEFIGEKRVLDTWFDSSNSPLWILQFERNNAFFKKNSPCSVRPQGKEIVRTWLYYSLLKNYLLNDSLIFENAWINYHITDEKGNKMSKSVGNVIDPKVVLDRFGAEPFRLWASLEGNLEKGDFKCSFDRIEGTQKTLTKLWNVSRFISSFEKPKKQPKLQALDEWIWNELNENMSFAIQQQEQFDFHNPSARWRNFLWETFASNYLELAKNRAYNSDSQFSTAEMDSARWTLHACLEKLLECWSPVIPIITFSLYQQLTGKNVHEQPFPKAEKKKKLAFNSQELIELNGTIWNEKKSRGLALNAPLDSAVIPKQFKSIEKDLKAAHKIQDMRWGAALTIK